MRIGVKSSIASPYDRGYQIRVAGDGPGNPRGPTHGADADADTTTTESIAGGAGAVVEWIEHLQTNPEGQIAGEPTIPAAQ